MKQEIEEKISQLSENQKLLYYIFYEDNGDLKIESNNNIRNIILSYNDFLGVINSIIHHFDRKDIEDYSKKFVEGNIYFILKKIKEIYDYNFKNFNKKELIEIINNIRNDEINQIEKQEEIFKKSYEKIKYFNHKIKSCFLILMEDFSGNNFYYYNINYKNFRDIIEYIIEQNSTIYAEVYELIHFKKIYKNIDDWVEGTTRVLKKIHS